jgi:4-hydroxy-4-methyl-2-oxoglutarate aldolase
MAIDEAILHKVSTASLTDAMRRKFSHEPYILDLKSPNPERLLFGEAATIRFIPYRADKADPDKNNFASLFYRAVGDRPEGKVLVLGTGGLIDTSLGGGVKLSRLQNHEMAGVLSEGRLRDWPELREYSFACYCSGETSRWGGDSLMPYEAGVPVSFRGVSIYPGDYVYALGEIAVVLPGAQLEAIFTEALAIEEDDGLFRQQIENEDPQQVLDSGGAEEKNN